MVIIEKAPAKINLGLDIVGKRPDGYHDLSMVMVSVDLNDYITVSEISGSDIIVESNNHKIPLNAKNDVFKAAQLIKNRYMASSLVLRLNWRKQSLSVLVWVAGQLMLLPLSGL